MVHKKVCPATGRDEFLELDPEIWSHLPQELLGKTLSKLPFAILVAFRAVCKEWRSVLVPLAAPPVQASGSRNRRPAFFYFNPDVNIPELSSPWVFQLQERVGCEVRNSFGTASFPLPGQDEYVRLLESEGGLLFFGLTHKQSSMVQDIVVSNPLTGISKRLQMPCPVKAWRDCMLREGLFVMDYTLIVGVALDDSMGTYQLVVLGTVELGRWPTLVYDSSRCTWTIYRSTLVNLLGALIDDEAVIFGGLAEMKRGIYCKGNMYWCTSRPSQAHSTILKFDMVAHVWTMVELPAEKCWDGLSGVQMVLYHGDVLLWHIHGWPSSQDRNDCPDCCHSDCAAQDCNAWTSNERSRVKQELYPGFNLLSNNMIVAIEDILYSLKGRLCYGMKHFGFSHGDFLYHFLFMSTTRRRYMLRAVTQEGNTLSWTDITLPSQVVDWYDPPPLDQLWMFSSSLTSVP